MINKETFTIAIVISISYFILKFVEMRVIVKKNKTIKDIIRETLLVYLSCISGFFIYEQLSPMKNMIKQTTPTVFTGEPDF